MKPAAWVERWQHETGDISAWLAEHGGTAAEYAFFPFGARYQYLILGVERTSGNILGLLNTPYRTFAEATSVGE